MAGENCWCKTPALPCQNCDLWSVEVSMWWWLKLNDYTICSLLINMMIMSKVLWVSLNCVKLSNYNHYMCIVVSDKNCFLYAVIVFSYQECCAFSGFTDNLACLHLYYVILLHWLAVAAGPHSSGHPNQYEHWLPYPPLQLHRWSGLTIDFSK